MKYTASIPAEATLFDSYLCSQVCLTQVQRNINHILPPHHIFTQFVTTQNFMTLVLSQCGLWTSTIIMVGSQNKYAAGVLPNVFLCVQLQSD